MIAIRPPEYLPRLAYFALVRSVDRFVIADTFEYSRQSFHHRTRLRNPDGWHWITVPIAWGQSTDAAVRVRIDPDAPRWREKHWRALMFDYRSTPYFEYFEEDVRPLFEEEWTRLGRLTARSVELVTDLMGLETRVERASELPGAPGTLEAIHEAVTWPETSPDESDPDSETVLSLEDAASRNRSSLPAVRTLTFSEPTYRQNFEGFEPGMSAVDALFNYGPDVTEWLDRGGTVEGPPT